MTTATGPARPLRRERTCDSSVNIGATHSVSSRSTRLSKWITPHPSSRRCCRNAVTFRHRRTSAAHRTRKGGQSFCDARRAGARGAVNAASRISRCSARRRKNRDWWQRTNQPARRKSVKLLHLQAAAAVLPLHGKNLRQAVAVAIAQRDADRRIRRFVLENAGNALSWTPSGE